MNSIVRQSLASPFAITAAALTGVARVVSGEVPARTFAREAWHKILTGYATKEPTTARESVRSLPQLKTEPAVAATPAIKNEAPIAKTPLTISKEPNLELPALGKLVVAIDLSTLYETGGKNSDLETFRQFQLDHVDQPMQKGKMWELVRRLLALNGIDPESRLVEVVIVSRMHPDASLRLDKTLHDKDLGLDIGRTYFIGEDSVEPYLQLLGAHLMISDDRDMAAKAVQAGLSSVFIPDYAPVVPPIADDEALVLGFDFDGVVGAGSSDAVFEKEGAKAYAAVEIDNLGKPLAEGPLFSYAAAVTELKQAIYAALRKRDDLKNLNLSQFESYVQQHELKTVMVTARGGGIAGHRAKLTLQDPGTGRLRVSFDRYLGTGQTLLHRFFPAQAKGPYLRLLNVHFHVDDGEKHIKSAAKHGVTGGHVIYSATHQP